MKKFLLFFISLAFIACGDDDNDTTEVEISTLTEQFEEDSAELLAYLQTHFYEYTEAADGTYNIVIDTIQGDNANKPAIINDSMLRDTTINVSSSHFGLAEEEEDVPHTLYYLILREGAGQNPTIGDSTLIKYKGQNLSREFFDASAAYTWLQLPSTIRGWAQGTSKLKTGTNLVTGTDGTAHYTDSGVGLLFIPSGLAYFSSIRSTAISSYEDLVFEIELGNYVPNTDTDNDGIPNIDEDLNSNGYLGDDNTDEEDENSLTGIFANYLDVDDDGDGVLTSTEISNADGNVIFPYPDSDNDDTPDYLDPDIQWDETEE